MTRSSALPSSAAIRGGNRHRLTLGFGVVGMLMLCGCGPSGVGSVDWDDNPKARAVGAPLKPPQKAAQPRRPSPKKTTEFIPG